MTKEAKSKMASVLEKSRLCVCEPIRRCTGALGPTGETILKRIVRGGQDAVQLAAFTLGRLVVLQDGRMGRYN